LRERPVVDNGRKVDGGAEGKKREMQRNKKKHQKVVFEVTKMPLL